MNNEQGPFDIIGDIHGCFDELKLLLRALGYVVERKNGFSGEPDYQAEHPAGRKAVFLGDLVDRGPHITAVLKLVMRMIEAGNALCVCGNHEIRVLKKIRERNFFTSHGGPDWSMVQLARGGPGFLDTVQHFIEGLVSHYVLDGGKLLVAHAGMKESLQGSNSPEVNDFALYGETTGEVDGYGLPVRYEWAVDYRGKAVVVYGHTPQARVRELNNTLNIDTGCVFGGKLTAFRYPEKEFVEVRALKVYCAPAKPFLPEHDAIAVQTRGNYGFFTDVDKPEI